MADDKTGVIYLITDATNGKQYVGKTTQSLRTRWNRHKLDARTGSDVYLHRAMRAHGVDNFSCEVYQDGIPVQYLDNFEVAIIRALGVLCNGYNRTPGGDGFASGPDHPNYGKTGPLSAAFGRKLSEESKAKLSVKRLGSNNPMFGKPSPNKNKPVSEEQKRKQSLAMTGRKRADSSSDYFGVTRDRNKWRTQIRDSTPARKRLFDKCCDTELEAALIYDAKVRELGLNRPLNFPDLAVAA
jgi:group I intron endonuclease